MPFSGYTFATQSMIDPKPDTNPDTTPDITRTV